jgi:hypothetical protein
MYKLSVRFTEMHEQTFQTPFPVVSADSVAYRTLILDNSMNSKDFGFVIQINR